VGPGRAGQRALYRMRRTLRPLCPTENSALQNPGDSEMDTHFRLEVRRISRLEGRGCIFPGFPIVRVVALQPLSPS
jgi:hypothetical protein